jgi:hypothetical protein
MESLLSTLQSSLQASVTSSMETRLTFFTLFIVLLLFLYVIVWLPFINGLATEVHQTKRILLLIPIELLVSMKKVSMLLKLISSSSGSEKRV